MKLVRHGHTHLEWFFRQTSIDSQPAMWTGLLSVGMKDERLGEDSFVTTTTNKNNANASRLVSQSASQSASQSVSQKDTREAERRAVTMTNNDENDGVDPLSEPLLAAPEQSETPDNHNDDTPESPPPSLSGLILFKTLYFLSGLSSSTWGRFGIIYYNNIQHLSPSQIGVLQGVTPLLGFVVQPLWGWLADYTLQRKHIYLVCKFCSTLSLLCLSLPSVNTFAKTLLCVVGIAVFRSSGVLDAHTLDFLTHAYKSMYGTIRMWAAISWGLGAIIMGYITDQYGFRYNFVLFGTMMTTVLILTWICLPEQSKSEIEKAEERKQLKEQQRRNTEAEADWIMVNHGESSDPSENDQKPTLAASGNVSTISSPSPPTATPPTATAPRLSVLFYTLSRWQVVMWLFQVAIIGAGMSLVDSFLFVFLENDLDASSTLCGWTVGVTVALEIPIMGYGERLLRVVGHDWLFCAALLAYAVRVWGYSLLTPNTVQYVLVLEILHGVTFGCMWIASVDFSAAVAPAEWWTTVQTVLSTTMGCIGGGFGPVVGGILMQRFGAVMLYRGAGTVVGSVLVLHLFVWLVCGQGHCAYLCKVKAERESNQQEEGPTTVDHVEQQTATDGTDDNNVVVTNSKDGDSEA